MDQPARYIACIAEDGPEELHSGVSNFTQQLVTRVPLNCPGNLGKI